MASDGGTPQKVDGGTGDGGTTDGGTDGGSSCSPACSGATPVCDEASKTCKRCTASAGCSGTTPVCNTSANAGSGECVQCMGDGDCTGGTVCDADAHQCVMPQGDGGTLPGDTCADALDIQFPSNSNTVSFSIDTSTGADDYEGFCSTTGSLEFVYRLVLSSAQDVTVTAAAAPNASGVDPVIFLTTEPCGTGTELGCVDKELSQPETLIVRNMAAGTYYLFIEGYDGYEGPTDVTVTLDAPTLPPANESCSGQVLLFADGGTSAVINDTLAAASYQYESSCHTSTGPDLVYRFDTSAPTQLYAKVTPAAGATIHPGLFLHESSDCLADAGFAGSDGGVSEQTGCVNGAAVNLPAELVVSPLPAGTHYLVVQGLQDTAGPFTLEANLSAVQTYSNDACGNAAQLTLDGGTAQVEWSTVGAMNDFQGDVCSTTGTAANPDVVFSFTTPATGGADGGLSARAIVVSRNGEAISPAVFLRSACEPDAGLELDCSSGESLWRYEAVAVADGLAPNSPYFVWVDSASQSAVEGPFWLKVDVAATPANDTCTGAIPLPANTSVPGTTLAAQNDFDDTNSFYGGTAECGEPLEGADVVYEFTPATTGPVTVTLMPERGFDGALAVLSACAIDSCIANEDPGYRAEPEVITFDGTAGVPVYIVVDSYDGDSTNDRARGGFIVSASQ